MIPSLLGKFQLSLIGRDMPIVSHQLHLYLGDIYSGIAGAKLHLLPGASNASELLRGKVLRSGTSY